MTIDKKSWGYRADARLEDFLTAEDLIKGIYLIYFIDDQKKNVQTLFHG